MQEEKFRVLRVYINEAYESGLNDDQIIERLSENGWQKDDINQAIRAVKAADVYATPKEATEPKANDNISKKFKKASTITNGKLPKYTVTNALIDAFNAFNSNIAMVILAGVLLFIATVILMAILFIVNLYLVFGGLYEENATLPFIALYLIALLLLAWQNGLFITGISIPIYDSLNDRRTSAKQLIVSFFTKSFKVTAAQIGLYLIIYIPTLIFSFVSAIFLSSANSFAVFIVSAIAFIVWVVLVVLRFALAPYVALFDKSVSLLKTYSKSYQLLKDGGQFFLVKLLIATAILYVVFYFGSQILTSNYYGSFGYNIFYLNALFSWLATLLIMFVVGVIINGIVVALYDNRSDLIDSKKNHNDDNQDAGQKAASSPLAK